MANYKVRQLYNRWDKNNGFLESYNRAGIFLSNIHVFITVFIHGVLKSIQFYFVLFSFELNDAHPFKIKIIGWEV
jgi:hypothetical protein